MTNADRVATRFYASALTLSGSTEVVTVVSLKNGLPDYYKISNWISNNRILLSKIDFNSHGNIIISFQKDIKSLVQKSLFINETNFNSIEEILLLELETPIKEGLWRIVLYYSSGNYFLSWRRNHIISDAFTTNLLLGQLLSEVSTKSIPPSATLVQSKDLSNLALPATPCCFRKIFDEKDSNKINYICHSLNATISSVVVYFLRTLLKNDPRQGQFVWVAFSRRTALNNSLPGCFIDVAKIPFDDSEESFHVDIQRCEAIIKEQKKTETLFFEKYIDSVVYVKNQFLSAQGPCATNSGRYRSLELNDNIIDISTCVDRRNGNYSVVAHIDRFRGRTAITLSSSSLVFNTNELKKLLTRLVNLIHDFNIK
ncbi:hypothetical protein AB1B75_000423 [Salmonella enterica]